MGEALTAIVATGLLAGAVTVFVIAALVWVGTDDDNDGEE